ncbi:hypothetical protein [Jonesia quinghaiensis]|uniref:hypothetical protein n=1 Tax=Jonesia quinghaiensis TaxID=262806 RepID=UPI00049045A2|nr:hypothetical protein [Jonesia quinghaiensis]
MKYTLLRRTRTTAVVSAVIGSFLMLTPAAASNAQFDVVASSEAPSGSSDIDDMSRTQSEDPTLENFVPSPSDPRYNQPQLLSARGWQGIGGFTVDVKGVPIGIPKIELWHYITGSGTKVSVESVEVRAKTGNVCNYHVSFQNRYGGTIYSTATTPVRWNCVYIGRVSPMIHNPAVRDKSLTLKRGVQCARLFVDGVFAGEQCHSIS